jgi:hypothetical protein
MKQQKSFWPSLIPVLVVFYTGCVSEQPAADAGAPDGSPFDAGVQDAGTDTGATDFINVEEREDPGAVPACPDPAPCTADYERFITLSAEHARHTSAPKIAQTLTRIDNGAVPLVPGPVAAETLKAAVTDGLNIGFLLEGLGPRPLTVTTIARKAAAGGEERTLLFNDPLVGEFKGILILPEGPGPFPAVVALHGHNDTAEIYRDQYHGSEYPGRGYAILMLSLRAMGSGTAALIEHEISLKLLLNGFTLMGLRVYESLLALKYLRHLPEVSGASIGLIGHSGGSSTGNLSVRLGAGFAAYVSDHQVDYAEWVPSIEVYHCETVPALYPYSALINDFSTSLTPVKTVPYKYTNGMDEIFDFLDTRLKNR